MADSILLLCERADSSGSKSERQQGGSRVFAVPAELGYLADRIERDMEERGWIVTRQEL